MGNFEAAIGELSVIAQLDTVPMKYQLAILDNCMNMQALKIYKGLAFGSGEGKNVISVMKNMELLVLCGISEIFEWYV